MELRYDISKGTAAARMCARPGIAQDWFRQDSGVHTASILSIYTRWCGIWDKPKSHMYMVEFLQAIEAISNLPTPLWCKEQIHHV